ncbi:hypothetical protein QFZ34_003227 [Phyllobacterium ifriqiyense]|uniref:Uncharacterized protein n=1 Tax=Phyllobacterium ifriqiyense TaxID=314238 RepID=A0ABU0SBA0_9HYPH|nr:hypothetical protein [Phyllobacterium ifriqiyense]
MIEGAETFSEKKTRIHNREQTMPCDNTKTPIENQPAQHFLVSV